MYRTNAQSRLMEEAFIHAQLPYRLVGAQRFYGRREVKDMIAFLRLVENPADEVSLLRVIGVPPRGIGEKTIVALQVAAFQAGISAGEVLLDLGKNGQDSPYWQQIGRSAALLADFGSLLNEWQAIKTQVSLVTLFDRIISDMGYEPYIKDQSDEGNDRWDNVQELRRLAYDFQEKGLTEFLQNLALVSDQDTIPSAAEQEQPERVQGAVTLLTLHAAKGLEFGPGVHHRAGRRPAAAQPLARRPRGNGGGTPPVLRGHDPRQEPALPAAHGTPLQFWQMGIQRTFALSGGY